MEGIQTFKETILRPYTLMVYFCNGTVGPSEEEIVSNENTGEELLIRKKKSFFKRTLQGLYKDSSIEIKRGIKKTNSKISSSGRFGPYALRIRAVSNGSKLAISIATPNGMP